LLVLFGLVCCAGAIGARAEAAFPGPDGRVIWIEKEFSETNSGDVFYVQQRSAPGEPRDRRGGCFA
jgi:hypothetical protein